jgi:hypothetical protein
VKILGASHYLLDAACHVWGRVQCMHIIKGLVVVLRFNVAVIMGISMKTRHLRDHVVVACDLALIVQKSST